MNELLQVGLNLFEKAPGPAALVIVAFMYFRMNKPKSDVEFVKREDCHRHIDTLKDDLKSSFDAVHNEIREIRNLIINHIDSGRQK